MHVFLYGPLHKCRSDTFWNKLFDPVYFNCVIKYVLDKLVCHNVNMKYNEINNSHKPVLSNTALIKYEEIVVTRVKIEI